MLYASTRNALTKSLGSTHFTDAIFATTKADLTPESYVAHKAHLAAPKPLSQRERELAEADRQATGASYEGTRGRRNHVNDGVGLKWSDEAVSAITELGQTESNHLTILVSMQARGEISAKTKPEHRYTLGNPARSII